jgi:hypothetical protein
VFLFITESELPTPRYETHAVEECTVKENKGQIRVMKRVVSNERGVCNVSKKQLLSV